MRFVWGVPWVQGLADGEVLEAAGCGGGELVAGQAAGEDEGFWVVEGQGSGAEVAVAGGRAYGDQRGSGGVVGVGRPGGTQVPGGLPVGAAGVPAAGGYESIAHCEEDVEVAAGPAVGERGQIGDHHATLATDTTGPVSSLARVSGLTLLVVGDTGTLAQVAIPAVSADLQHLVDFARRWYLYGGGSAEDIFVTFGLTEQDYFRRLDWVLRTHGVATGLDPATIDAIQQVGTRRLSQT